MYAVLNGLLADKKGGAVFECFNIFHFIYMAVIFAAIILAVVLLRKKSDKSKMIAVEAAIGGAFGLYMLDFFLMPFAYGEIDIEKLPFHVCTAMCVLCFLSRRVPLLKKFKAQFALLGLISNLIYVIYPAGVMWYQVHPLSYRVLQTLLFHGLVTAYGVLSIAFGDVKLEIGKWYKDLAAVVGMALWALIGNTFYNGSAGNYSHNFNWFFVVRDPFYLFPESISPYIMPFIVVAAFFAVEMAVHLVYFFVKRVVAKRR